METQYPRLEVREVASLKSHPDGVRTHQQESAFYLGKCFDQFKLLRLPVLNVVTNTIIDGDLLLTVLRERGVKECPVWCVEVSAELEDLAHLALNNHAGEWQWQPVSELLKALQAKGQSLGLTGFHSSDYGPLTAADWTAPKIGPMDGSCGEQQSFL